MKRVFQFFFFITLIFFLISSCKKDSVSNAKKYAGVYVGDVTQVEGSMNKMTVIKNCTIIITSTDNSGQVTVETDKIFYSKMIGNIYGTILTLTPKEDNVTSTIISKKYGTATFSGNSINIDLKQDDNQNGNLYYQTRWNGILKK